MSATDLDPDPHGAGAGRRARADLRVSARGVRTVAVLELRQRVRSSRWVVVLAVWVAVLVGVTALVAAATDELVGSDGGGGSLLFSAVTFLVLGLGVLVAPALTATSINGDRGSGVLAPLQVTLLHPADLALGKLLAGWLSAMALLATALPVLLWAVVAGGEGLLRAVVVLVLLAVVLGVVCAVGLGWSALVARTAASAVLTYVSVAALTLGLPLLFGLSYPLVTGEEPVQVRDAVSYTDEGLAVGCEETTQVSPVSHTERTWWLLAASPFVVVADAAPRPDVTDPEGYPAFDPLSELRSGVRTAKAGPREVEDWCSDYSPEQAQEEQDRVDAAGPAWPWGLGIDLLVGAAGVAVAVRRLQVPIGVLPRGTRVA